MVLFYLLFIANGLKSVVTIWVEATPLVIFFSVAKMKDYKSFENAVTLIRIEDRLKDIIPQPLTIL